MKITAAALIMVAVLLLSGIIYVGVRRTDKTPSLVYYTGDYVISLDPADTDDAGSMVPISNIYETLVEYSSNESSGGFSAGLATSWAVSPNGLMCNFTLRQGVKFSNGNTFNAYDVKFSIERVLLMDSPATGVADILSRSVDLNSTLVQSDYELSISLNEPYSGFLATIAQPYPLAILDREYTLEHYSAADKYAHDFMSSHPMGTGPYMLESWHKGTELVLSQNPTYWGGWAGNHIEKVIIREISSAKSRIEELQLGKAQIADVPLSNLTDLEGYSGVAIRSFRSYDIEIAVMNVNHSRTSHSFMRDARIRQAFCYAFDYPYTSARIYSHHIGDLQGCIPNGIPLANESQPNKSFSYSLQIASQILNSTGHFLDAGGHRFNGTTMTLVVQPGDSLRMAAANSYADSLRRLGILVVVQEGDRSILGSKGDWDMFFTSKSARYADSDDNVMQLLVSAAQGGDMFITGIADTVIDSAAVAGSRAITNASRISEYLRVWSESNANPNMILIGQLDRVVAYDKTVEDLQFDPITGLTFYNMARSG